MHAGERQRDERSENRDALAPAARQNRAQKINGDMSALGEGRGKERRHDERHKQAVEIGYPVNGIGKQPPHHDIGDREHGQHHQTNKAHQRQPFRNCAGQIVRVWRIMHRCDFYLPARSFFSSSFTTARMSCRFLLLPGPFVDDLFHDLVVGCLVGLVGDDNACGSCRP